MDNINEAVKEFLLDCILNDRIVRWNKSRENIRHEKLVLSNLDLSDCEIENLDLSYIMFKNSNFNNTSFKNTNFSHSTFYNTSFFGTTSENCNYYTVNFEKANLSYSYFIKCYCSILLSSFFKSFIIR
jgi:uncharacterized protein YjbI with pentapeptide repeats